MLDKEETKSPAARPKRKATGTTASTKAPARRTAARKPKAGARHEGDLQQLIQERAYQLWESEGRPEGREQAHWQQAQRELTAQPPG
ncbi:MAG TPA: DUF2934 domain-containing protein [Geminicoccaceae bacterium]|nr:DUF2934 domain-containing protein [Geminicoccaceae bacterium]